MKELLISNATGKTSYSFGGFMDKKWQKKTPTAEI